jgi:hypothetical protein
MCTYDVPKLDFWRMCIKWCGEEGVSYRRASWTEGALPKKNLLGFSSVYGEYRYGMNGNTSGNENIRCLGRGRLDT